jgi:hypothetical protein
MFSGSRVANRGAQDIFADYFGLPSDYQGIVTLTPTIKNIIFDVSSYANIYSNERTYRTDNLYIFVNAPLVHTRWNSGFKEEIIDAGKNFQPAGYMGKGTNRIPRDLLAPNVATALQGEFIFGDMLEPLRFGKINGSRSATNISDIHVALGWHAQFQKNRHLSLFFQVGIPTGARPDAEFFFEPQIGNTHHWEIGGGVNFYLQLWQNMCQDSVFALALRTYIAHLAATSQKRSFDLKNSAGSRYMLLQTMGTPVDNLQIPAGNPIKVQYQGFLIPAIHATTLDCRISVGYQVDLAIAFRLSKCAFDFDLGYNMWARGKEKIKERDRLVADRYALKGDASLYGFEVGSQRFFGLNATQHEATVFSGQGNGNTTFANLNADNAAIAGGGLRQLTPADSLSLGIPLDNARGSNQPILLVDSDINESSALSPSVITHTFFSQLIYSPELAYKRAIYFALGMSTEFATKSDGVCAANNQWSIWMQGGINF